VAHDQRAEERAQAEKDEPVLVVRGVGVWDENRVLAEKTDRASSNVTPCFSRLRRAFCSSHSNRILDTEPIIPTT
jgi:hypothetical protein